MELLSQALFLHSESGSEFMLRTGVFSEVSEFFLYSAYRSEKFMPWGAQANATGFLGHRTCVLT
jgi:hypothetical protein